MKRKIAMIEPLGDGGIAHYSHNLLNALSRKRVHALLFTSSNYELLNESLQYKVHNLMFSLADKLIRLFPWLDKEEPRPSIIRRLIKLMEYPINVLQITQVVIRKNIRIVHYQSVNYVDLLGILCLKAAGRKIVYTIHNVMPLHGALRAHHKTIYRCIYNLCDELIIHSFEGKVKIIAIYKVSGKKISVIPHGDYKFFVPQKKLSTDQAKRNIGIPTKCPTLLFFGAIRPNKGLEQALYLLKHLKRHLPDVKLVIAGELCENWEKYRKIIQENNLSENISEHFNYIPNSKVSMFFQSADIVLLPYHEITQSGVLQIAYAFAKPVIATALDGFRESIKNNENGFLVEDGDYESFSEKARFLLNDETLRNKMGLYSKRLSEERYSWETIAGKTLQLYDSITTSDSNNLDSTTYRT
jgi:D-inositol-3-phosphate glycosyltransferase